jgi:cytochrome P460
MSMRSFGVVYVNDLARAAFGTGAKFPTGSIIVRERLLEPSDLTPQALAVMIKRAPGFHPKGGDWEFLLVNGAVSEVVERQKKGSCLECHASQRKQDFVFPISTGK